MKPGPSTRTVHAGPAGRERGAPLLPPPSLASATHLAGDPDPVGYARFQGASRTALEAALGDLEGAQARTFSSGMAAMTALLVTELEARGGGAVVLPDDGYPGVRGLVAERLVPWGVEARPVPTDLAAYEAAIDADVAVVWLETPSNPLLDVVDVAQLAERAHAAGAALLVDNTLCTPLGQRPLDLGADATLTSATKALAGHSDVLLGVVATRDEARAERVARYQVNAGAVPSAFDCWLVHRSLATLGLRLERQSHNAAALAAALREREDVLDVRHPGAHPQMAFCGPLVGFDPGGAERADALLAACSLVATASSFGGVHASAERRGRWGTDPVSDGFIRFSCGIEDPADLVADVLAALDATR